MNYKREAEDKGIKRQGMGKGWHRKEGEINIPEGGDRLQIKREMTKELRDRGYGKRVRKRERE